MFESCLRTVDWKLYRAWCVKDACVKPASQSVCTMISALAFSCATRGVHVDWMSDDELAGFCRGFSSLSKSLEMLLPTQGVQNDASATLSNLS